MTRHVRAADLNRRRHHLASHLEVIHANGDADARQRVLDLLRDLTRCVDYVIDGKVCTSLFASMTSASDAKVDVDALPTGHGLVMLDVPYRLSTVDGLLTGIMWSRTDDAVRLTPLTWASQLGLLPPRSVAPMMLGYEVPAGTAAWVDTEVDTSEVTALAVALWRRIPLQEVRVIGNGKRSGVMVTHSRRSTVQNLCGWLSPGWSAVTVRWLA